MKLLEEGYLLLAQPRVIHAIPGRLRLHVPMLKRLGREYHCWTELLTGLLKEVQGLKDVSANDVLGTILVYYEVTEVSERQILAFMSSMSKVLMAQKDDLIQLLAKDSDTVFGCLQDWLQRSVKRGLQLDMDQRILRDDCF